MRKNSFIQQWLILCFSVFLLACKGKKAEKIGENEFYVCSMDPQVMEKQPGLCPICKMPLTKATIDIGQMKGIQLNDEQAKLANIKVEEISTSGIQRQTILNGVFVVNQNQTEQVSARIRGRIEKLYYKVVGTQVNVGDKLYDLYSRELLQAQEEYLLAIEKGRLLKSSSQTFVSAAKNKLLLWGLSENQISQLENSREPKITTSIYAKAGGVITDIPLKEGEYVNEGTEVYKIADLRSLWVEAQLYTNELSYLQEGRQVEVVPEAYPNERIQGVVTFTNPELQQQTKVNLIRITISNSSLKYKPGMQARIFLKSQGRTGIVLPVDAVIQNAHNTVVWIQTDKNKFEPKTVTTGIQNANEVEIISGLQEGDEVVISGAYLLNSEFIFKRGMNPVSNDTMTAPDHSKMNM